MRKWFCPPWLLFLLAVLVAPMPADGGPGQSSKRALQAFNDLIGSWKGTGIPAGSRDDRQRFWIETICWQWQFKGNDAWLKVDFARSKNFHSGELRHLKEKEFQLTLRTPAKENLVFTGQLRKRVLTLERESKGKRQRLIISLLHANRYLYRYEVRPEGKSLFGRRYQVGATRQGVPFAEGDGRPECIVSGGLGSIAVMFKGQTYYVCCRGCRDEFNDNPEKYIKEYQAKKAGTKK